eukprot:XP_001693124.1 predicted protein [Chlamydomonas reinhardtii]
MRNPDAAARSETGLDRQLGHLRRAARAVFPCGYVDKLLTNAGNKMRCGLAQWLLEQRAVVAPAGAPPVSGEYLTGAPVPLTSVEAYLRQQHAGLWLNRTVFKWPKPADFLRHADSHGIFLVLQTAADAPQGGGGGGGAGAAAGGQYPAVMLDGGALAAVFLEDAERGYGGSRPPGASDAAVLADSAAANVALAKAVAALARDAFPGATASDLTNVAPYGVHAVTDPAQRSAVARVYSAAEAACHVRRALVGWLAASRRLANVAPLSAPMSTLGESLRKEHAGLWAECDPSGGGRPPKLKDFLLQPESRGVFRVWAAGEAASSSSAGPAGGRQMVELQVDALWFAALRYTAPLSLLHPDLASWSAAAGPSSAAGSSTAPLESAAAAPGTSGRAALGRPPMAAAAAAAAPLNASAAPAPAAASEAQLEALRSKPVQELARMAFPTHVHGQPVKDQPARQLRRAIAAWLDGDADAAQGLGPRRARLSGLGHFLKRQHADVWLDPKRKWPKLKDFLTQPQSRGVFQLLPSPTLVASDVDAAPQHYDHDTTSSDNAFPPPSPEELAAAGLPAAQAVVVADPYGNELVALLQHCHSCDRLGLAVQSYYGLPTMVMLYAPAALMPLAAQPPEAGGDGGAAAGDEGSFIAWPAAVYVVDLLAAKLQYGDGEDGHAAADALLVSLRPLLEAPGVTKVVHDGGAAAGRWGAAAAAAAGSGDGLGGTVAVLEAAVSASSAHLMVLGEDGVSLVQAAAGGPCRIAPLHDTRLVLRGLEAMLGLPHLPPAALAVPDADPTSSGVLGQLHDLHVHVTRLHDALAGTGLWADRPALLAALVARHSTALRHELLEACAYGGDGAAAAGMDGLLERPLGAGVVEAVAGDARHLPELWGETVATALPWVAERGAAAVHSS